MKKIFIILVLCLICVGTLYSEQMFIADISTKTYHTLICEKVKNIKEDKKLFFTSIKGIQQVGFKSCLICQLREK